MSGKKAATPSNKGEDTLSFFSLNRSRQSAEVERPSMMPKISRLNTNSGSLKRSQSDDLDISSDDDDDKTDTDGSQTTEIKSKSKTTSVVEGMPDSNGPSAAKGPATKRLDTKEAKEREARESVHRSEEQYVEIDSVIEIDDSSEVSPVDSNVHDIEDIQETVDPILEAKISERLARIKASKGLAVFDVGLVLRNKLGELEVPVVVIKIASNDTFEVGRKKYIEELKQRKLVVDSSDVEKIRNAVFVWQFTRIFDFATPQLLHIRSSAPSVIIDVMTVEQFQEMEQKRQEAAMSISDTKKQDADESDDGFSVSDNEPEIDQATSQQPASAETESDDGYFRVILKGRDNVPVEVKVNFDTVISKLIEFYKKKRDISAGAKVWLEFDDEPLDPTSHIKDTELEEDFMIDVYVE